MQFCQLCPLRAVFNFVISFLHTYRSTLLLQFYWRVIGLYSCNKFIKKDFFIFDIYFDDSLRIVVLHAQCTPSIHESHSCIISSVYEKCVSNFLFLSFENTAYAHDWWHHFMSIRFNKQQKMVFILGLSKAPS